MESLEPGVKLTFNIKLILSTYFPFTATSGDVFVVASVVRHWSG